MEHFDIKDASLVVVGVNGGEFVLPISFQNRFSFTPETIILIDICFFLRYLLGSAYLRSLQGVKITGQRRTALTTAVALF
jgi:hypothetical protein